MHQRTLQRKQLYTMHQVLCQRHRSALMLLQYHHRYQPRRRLLPWRQLPQRRMQRLQPTRSRAPAPSPRPRPPTKAASWMTTIPNLMKATHRTTCSSSLRHRVHQASQCCSAHAFVASVRHHLLQSGATTKRNKRCVLNYTLNAAALARVPLADHTVCSWTASSSISMNEESASARYSRTFASTKPTSRRQLKSARTS